MVVYMLEQRCKILRHYFGNHANVAECMRKLCMNFGKLVRTSENIAAEAERVSEVPSTSIQHRSQQLNISAITLQRILYKDLGMTPYKAQLVQELKPIDHSMRSPFAKWAFGRLTEDTDFGKKKIFLGEAHFDLGGYVNKRNCQK